MPMTDEEREFAMQKILAASKFNVSIGHASGLAEAGARALQEAANGAGPVMSELSIDLLRRAIAMVEAQQASMAE